MSRLYTVEEIEEAFNHYDTSGDGQIEKAEFIKCITTIFPDFKTEIADRWFDEVDKDHSGFLDVEEFTCVVREIENVVNKDNTFISLWHIYDDDHNGVLDLDEFKKMWKSLLKDISDDILEKFFKVADDDGNGTISYIEYMHMASIIDKELCKHSHLYQ